MRYVSETVISDIRSRSRVYFWQSPPAAQRDSLFLRAICLLTFPPIFRVTVVNEELRGSIFIIALPYLVIVVSNFFEVPLKSHFNKLNKKIFFT